MLTFALRNAPSIDIFAWTRNTLASCNPHNIKKEALQSGTVTMTYVHKFALIPREPMQTHFQITQNSIKYQPTIHHNTQIPNPRRHASRRRIRRRPHRSLRQRNHIRREQDRRCPQRRLRRKSQSLHPSHNFPLPAYSNIPFAFPGTSFLRRRPLWQSCTST